LEFTHYNLTLQILIRLVSPLFQVLDATNNEAWGPHGSLLADIAQATRN